MIRLSIATKLGSLTIGVVILTPKNQSFLICFILTQ